MTLRLRLTLLYTLLVAIILIVSGVALHVLFQRSLQTNFDKGMTEVSQLLLSTLEQEEYELDEDIYIEIDARSFPSDQIALIVDVNGEILSSLGTNSSLGVSPAWLTSPDGFHQQSDNRILVTSIVNRDLLKLILIRDNHSVQQTLRQFDRLFLLLLPIAILCSLILGYLLAKQALSPVDRLTKAAYDLAKRRAWRERLPEPKTQDELWRLGTATNTLLSSLQDVIESERRFTADAAHELRTPLTVLQGRIEQALENADANNRPRLLKAHAACEQLLGLVEKLLMLARTEAGQGLQREELALDEVAFHTANDMKSLFDAKGIELELTLPEEEATIFGDHIAISLLIKNLLENALKFTEKGQVSLTVTEKNKQAILTIQDTGKGIPEDTLPHLFDRFYQTDVEHRQKGSGLGLALVKSIADWHGATIEVKNTSNNGDGGAEFTVTFSQL